MKFLHGGMPVIAATVAADCAEQDIHTLAGSPSSANPVYIIITIAAGVKVSGGGSYPPLRAVGGDYHARTRIKVINNGYLAGKGGNGGGGGLWPTDDGHGGAGYPGGDAFLNSTALTIVVDNTNGYIFAGGGGGGGGDSWVGIDGGGGGGGGQGSPAGLGGAGGGGMFPGGPGGDGSFDAPGAGGTAVLEGANPGGSGGGWGSSDGYALHNTGGGGFNVIGGDNASQIKGGRT